MKLNELIEKVRGVSGCKNPELRVVLTDASKPGFQKLDDVMQVAHRNQYSDEPHFMSSREIEKGDFVVLDFG